ncbi:MAG: hypothetical protein RI894_2083 [Bacteroidota bacterium]|jgi:hypothetical protein
MQDHSLYLKLINNFFDIEKKVLQKTEMQPLMRNIDRMKATFEEMGYIIRNPKGEGYSETRTDCEASIVGESTESLVITDVIKPIVYWRIGEILGIVQQGIVLVEAAEASKKEKKGWFGK